MGLFLFFYIVYWRSYILFLSTKSQWMKIQNIHIVSLYLLNDILYEKQSQYHRFQPHHPPVILTTCMLIFIHYRLFIYYFKFTPWSIYHFYVAHFSSLNFWLQTWFQSHAPVITSSLVFFLSLLQACLFNQRSALKLNHSLSYCWLTNSWGVQSYRLWYNIYQRFSRPEGSDYKIRDLIWKNKIINKIQLSTWNNGI